MPEEIERVAVVYGVMEGEICRSLLEAHGIPVMLSSEAAGSAYRVNVGMLGRVEVFVPASRSEEAKGILADGFRSPASSPPAPENEDPPPASDP
ncbi:MAG: DUF2007 domain-containing protein [Anaerolineales bacterium]|jgi:hypothetical protein